MFSLVRLLCSKNLRGLETNAREINELVTI